MSQIISISNQKGGVGKSTIAFNLAAALADNKHTVFVVDADPQGTVSMWAKARIRHKSNKINPNVTFTENPWTPEEILKLSQKQNYDFVIIDCGPANNKATKATLVVSNLTIIPISPSPLDINSARSTIELIEEGASRGATKSKVCLLISKKIVGTNLAKEARDACQMLKLPILKTEISQRVALCESAITGQSVLEYAPNSMAAEEFIALEKEVKKCLKQN
ncbi:MAG: AAA family ATPase [Syntrophaceae bacterium]|nr:AAA family ATPase [Candidatus Omnitrophota bacterium]MCG2739151.1 AAA family ATPase [Syntrophaceae bacterium]